MQMFFSQKEEKINININFREITDAKNEQNMTKIILNQQIKQNLIH